MTDAEKLSVLKQDLQQMTTANDALLMNLLRQAKSAIETEGITLTEGDIGSDMMVIQYAAYLFRKRAAPETEMPRFLRWNMNNTLFKQKGSENDV